MRALLLTLSLCALPLSSCTCTPEVEPPPVVGPIGTVRVEATAGSATLALVDLTEPLSAFQVDVGVSGGKANAVFGLADHDIVEAGLAEADGGPKDRFTAVVSDTRRLPINNGPLLRVSLDDGATIAVTGAFGTDPEGKKRSLTVVTE